MKLAIPTRDAMVDDHFGHCAYYTVFEIEDGKVLNQERLDSPQGCGCKSNIASVLRELGVSVMLAGSMGDGAKRVLEAQNIKVIRGCSGAIAVVLAAYLGGIISDSGEGCSHHHEGEEHQCPNH